MVSLPVLIGFDRSTAKFQFCENHVWIESLNINYVVGVDGISILLLIMTTLESRS